MPERTGKRDLTYSAWHRPESLKRFLSSDVAARMTKQDIDELEYCVHCGEPLILGEIASDVGQVSKPTLPLEKLAISAGTPAFLLFYRRVVTGKKRCPACDGTGEIEVADIDRFRMRYISPVFSPEEKLIPQQWAEFLAELRRTHYCMGKP